jgi:uncharacterized membrane protein
MFKGVNVMNEFQWAYIGTTAGLAAAVSAITQIIKRYMTKTDPKWIALILSALLSIGYRMVFLGEATAETMIIAVVNSIIAAGAAIGAFEGVTKPVIDGIGQSHKGGE